MYKIIAYNLYDEEDEVFCGFEKVEELYGVMEVLGNGARQWKEVTLHFFSYDLMAAVVEVEEEEEEADEVPKDVTKRLKSFSLCPAILVSVLYAFRCTAETLNKRPHHLSDSVRQRERMSRSKMPLEYIHLGKHAIDTRPSDAIIERSLKDESVARNDGDEHLEDAPSKENHKEGLEIEDDIGSENDHFDKPQAYNGRKREVSRRRAPFIGYVHSAIIVKDTIKLFPNLQ
ncbi:hypothetical protein Tco_0674148 [Tanacetum coccineum]